MNEAHSNISHGLTAAIMQWLWGRDENSRCDLDGYREEGRTTKPFNMHIHNRTSRRHLIIQRAQRIAEWRCSNG
jgi:xylulose-5-phosphate/fructose-6-phosphate phosphoketolase